MTPPTASIRQRLLNLAHARGEEFQHLLMRYGNERFLARLAASPHADAFVVKGAILFSLWAGEPHRATRDLDLLGSGSAALARLEAIFRELCQATTVETDGLIFDARSVVVARIKEEDEYEGVRITLVARLGVAKIPLQVDVGFGDAITPRPVTTTFPTLLPMPAPTLLAYPRATVVAEKFHAMATLGLPNSRMKDFFDVWLLARTYEFDGAELRSAIEATFERRGSLLPRGLPLALTATFSSDGAKRTQWKAFLGRARPNVIPPAFDAVVAEIATFVGPMIGTEAAPARWLPGGPWVAS